MPGPRLLTRVACSNCGFAFARVSNDGDTGCSDTVGCGGCGVRLALDGEISQDNVLCFLHGLDCPAPTLEVVREAMIRRHARLMRLEMRIHKVTQERGRLQQTVTALEWKVADLRRCNVEAIADLRLRVEAIGMSVSRLEQQQQQLAAWDGVAWAARDR